MNKDEKACEELSAMDEMCIRDRIRSALSAA